jgi:ABC-type nickel/cobalt efflux system permease component RcnA
MVGITKNQIALSLIVIVFATIMITGNIKSSIDNSAFASRNHHHHSNNHHHHHHHSDHFNNPDDKSSNTSQKIDQSSHQNQNSFCLSAGAFSPVSASCNNTATSANFNTGSNGAAASGQ